ncbi:Fc receptor-like protein 5 [Etheostoma spectabile]|uniref:Fc receptor-like protein 5 n=1 Tax=Etheostoma spectabile TaxID=54343 RepID=UPI0013AEDD67|nr:Fc receptor-like protein 5 [Etheostoma spectabile]
MEVTALGFRLLTDVVLLLTVKVLNFNAKKADAAFPHISPNQLQFFEYESISVDCGELDHSSEWRVMRKLKEDPTNTSQWETSTGTITIEIPFTSDTGEYWCENKEGGRSNSVNITITAGDVILQSPMVPAMEGDSVSLSCRNKKAVSNLPADFYKDGHFSSTGYKGKFIINNVSKSDEGLYKCSISGAGGSPESWLAVRGGSGMLETPVLPVEEDVVTFHCKNSIASSNIVASFYKDGFLLKNISTGNMTIHCASGSEEGLYRCNTSREGESPESWLVVRDNMEATALRIRPLINVLFLLCALDQKVHSVFIRVVPDRLQFFEYDPVAFHCEGVKGQVLSCRSTSTQGFKQTRCNITSVYPEDSGAYWCEAEGGERSNSVNINVTAHSVILESPARPVMEGESVTLSCRNKTASSNLAADFYKDGRLIRSSSPGIMTLHSVSKPDEGLYKCSISGAGESPQSLLAVTVSTKETSPTSSSTPWIVVTVLLTLLLLAVGLLHFGKGYFHRVMLYLSSVTAGSGLPEDQTVSVETSAADANKVTYAVAAKSRRKKDEDEFASAPIYYTLGLGDTEQLAEHAAGINPSLTENALYASIQ